jgi:hypothetical protein
MRKVVFESRSRITVLSRWSIALLQISCCRQLPIYELIWKFYEHSHLLLARSYNPNMNIFRILGKKRSCAQGYDIATVDLTRYSGLVASCFHIHSHSEDAIIQRMSHMHVQNSRRRLIDSHQSASGISFKSQFLYLVVYITRYLGMVFRFSASLVA